MGHTPKEKKEMLLSELVSQYADYMKTAKPLSATTTGNYLCRTKRFCTTIGQDARLPDLTRGAILRYLNRISDISAIAVRMHHASIRHFCKWLVSEEWLKVSPAENIPLPKITRNRRQPVPDDAVQRLVDACDRLPRSEYKRVLIRAALSLLVYGGLRRSEALRLEMSDVHLDRGEIFLRHTKGNKSRPVFLCKEALEALRALVKARPSNCRHNFLLASNATFGLMYAGLDSLLHDIHTVAGIEERYTPHQLRHAYASRLARNGASLPAIQAALGHSRMETTAQYLHTNEDDLRAIAHLASLKPSALPETPKTAPAPPAGKREEQKRFHVRRRLR